MSVVKKQTKKQIADALRATRTGIEAAIVAALQDRHGAVVALAMRDVEVGRLLNQYRDTFDIVGVKASDAAKAFNLQAERITQWKYAMYRRVMQAATAADLTAGAQDACNGSVEALAALSRVTPDKAAEIVAVALEATATLTRDAIIALADETPAADRKKQERDAAKRKEQHIASLIAKDIDSVMRKIAKLDPATRTLIASALVTGSKWQHGPLTPRVATSSIRAWNQNENK